MQNSLEEPSSTIPAAGAREALPLGSEQALPLPPPPGLIRTAEAIGGTLGRIVHGGRAVYAKLDVRHHEDMGAIRNAAGELQAKTTEIAHDVSETSSNVVQYIRTHNAKDVVRDLERMAKRYPVQALTLVAVAGFFLERALLRRRL